MHSRDDEMLDMFLSESEQNVQALDSLLLAAQRAATLNQQDIAEAFRLVHTLKGASSMMQYHAPEQSAHLLEDILSVLRGNADLTLSNTNIDIVGLGFRFADYYSEQLERIKEGNDAVASEQLNEALLAAAVSMHKESVDIPETAYTLPASSFQPPAGSTLLYLHLRKCAMPHIRCSVVVKAILGLCTSVLTVPRDIELHPELGAHILENGLELYVSPNSGVELAQITEKLRRQPYVESVSVPDPKETARSDRQRESTIHVPQSKLNSLMAILDELVTTQSMLGAVLDTAAVSDSRAAYLMERLRHDAAQARDLSAEMGMVELGTVFGQMRRLVRMMAQERGRSIVFTSAGDSVPIDGSMVEMISDALLHLVRNAVDHGIEPPDTRTQSGKKADGTIAVSAKKENGLLTLTVADDGCGIDRKSVLKKAFDRGVIPQERQTCSNTELLEILAAPGFTTKSDISKYSGRGVGLDTAVKRVRDMQGSISLESTPGQGSCFILRVPTTLSLLSVLPLYIGKDRVLLPSSAVAAVCFADRTSHRGDKVVYQEQSYSRIRIPSAPCDSRDDMLIFFQPQYGPYCIRATRTDMVEELLLFPLPQYVSDMLGKANLFNGCCIDKGGEIMCVIDIYKLIETNDTQLRGETKVKIFDDENLNPDVADALFELNNVGAGQASIALSKMMGITLSIGRPRVSRGKLTELPLTSDNPDKIDMGIVMTMDKTFSGVVLFVIDKRFLSDLFFKMTGVRYHADEILNNEDSLSATREIANIIASAYTKAIGTYTGIRLYLTPAMVGIDQIDSLISFALKHYDIKHDRIICVDTSFSAANSSEEPEAYASRIIMLPDDESVEKMMDALGI